MMTVAATMVFMGALALAMAAMWITVAPQWQRVVRLAAGNVEQPFISFDSLARGEHRLAVRRSASVPVPVRRLRAA